MTPREIKGRLKAFEVTLIRKEKGKDKLAWLIGNYVGVAVNNPSKFPEKPNMIKSVIELSEEEMEEEDMKTILTSFAESHNAIEEVK